MDTRSTKRTTEEETTDTVQKDDKSLDEIYVLMEKQMDLMKSQRKLQQEQDGRLQETLASSNRS